MTDETSEQICLEFFDPTIDGEPHLGIQTTLKTGETYWMALTGTAMAAYITVLLEQALDMGTPFLLPTLHAVNKFVADQIAASQAEGKNTPG